MMQQAISVLVLGFSLLLVACGTGPKLAADGSDKIFGNLVFGSTGGKNRENSTDADNAADSVSQKDSNGSGVTIWQGSLNDSSDKSSQAAGFGPQAVAVNDYLWRASLQVAGALPLQQVDRNSGVIITDWYDTQSEETGMRDRFRLNILVVSAEFRSDGVRVVPFHQRFDDGKWVSLRVSDVVGQRIVDDILQKANGMRLSVQAPYDVVRPLP